jgi:hypothetical protein
VRGFTWTEKRDRLLGELRRQGLSQREAARALGCDLAHVRERLATLGDCVRREPPRQDWRAVPRPHGVERRSTTEYPRGGVWYGSRGPHHGGIDRRPAGESR